MAKISIVVAACLLCFACAHVEPPKEAPKLVKPVEIPSPVLAQVEKEKKIDLGGPKELFSFSLREADIKDVLRGVAKQTNYNVVVEPDVKGVCTVDLKNVSIEKALEYILDPLNYVYRIEDRTIYVSKPKLETKTFPLNYSAVLRRGMSTLYATSGTERAGQRIVGIEERTETMMDVWTGFEATLRGLLSPEGKLSVNRQAALVAVTDYPKNLKQIGSFIKSMEEAIQRQIVIEARIIEVTLNNEFREGVNWQYIGAQLGQLSLNMQQRFLDVIDPTNIVSGTQFFRANVGVIGGKLNIDNTFIDLLRTQGKLSFLSNPKIATLNNQRAVIKVATDDVVFETTETITSTGIPTFATVIKYITIGLVLDVVPQIDDQGNIVMNIHPMLSERTGDERVDLRSGTRVPVLNVREVDTTVRLREGETAVIGGLIKDTKTNKAAGIPGLSSVPLLGWAFRANDEITQRTELVILLTPRVIYTKDPL